MSRFDEMKELLDQLEPDINKFYNKGNKAAGTRARKTLQEMKKKAQEIRLEIQDWKNSGKVDNI
ncbi:MAG: histone H1 [Balneolaceae bacterium]|nr:histone H1 [Balneolaceae bacterium]